MDWERFPVSIESRMLGVFHLEPSDATAPVYRPELPLRIKSQLISVSNTGTDWCVWPPEDGIPDTSIFVSAVETRASYISVHLDEIIRAGMRLITEEIDEFWQIPDEPAPSAETILRSGMLRYLCLNAGDGGHRIIIYDHGDHIGGHDLNIETDADFRPRSVHFDG